ncbi:MAG TPA: RNA polymerase sigma factor [Kofleriaceae bacterium]|jgi:RNA polymerase sigma-70 factor (ECF subfamily)|nr:RNA polymerase sigma factor [Kofleriaceae bacterium]
MQSAAAIEAAFRRERARVLATTIRATHGDFDLAEEAVQDAFAAAIARWPVEGTPDEPRGWLIAVARHKAIDAIRRRVKLREIVSEQAAQAAGDACDAPSERVAVADDRLRLIYTCCHPALATEAQIALTLRTLGGLTTEEIARAFLTSPVTMAQRLVRAKSKIRDAGIPYEVPEAAQLAERTGAVMAVVYLIFNEGYAATAGDTWIRRDLCGEAIRLGRLVAELTGDAEARGLLALMLLHDARRDARTDARGDVVLLEDQDRSRWDQAQITEALALVPDALRGGPGPYSLQAAIAALHASAPRACDTDWRQIAGLFNELARRQPTPIVALNRAVAIAMWQGPDAGLALIDQLADALAGYHLWHAARADLLRRLGRHPEAAAAYRAALDHVGSAPERRFLEGRLAEVSGSACDTR